MKKFLSFVCRRPIACISLCLLILLYLMMIFAEFIAPYEPTTSFENKSYHPPNVRFYDYGLTAQEARVINTVNWKYARVKDLYVDIDFFVKVKLQLYTRQCLGGSALQPLFRHFLKFLHSNYYQELLK